MLLVEFDHEYSILNSYSKSLNITGIETEELIGKDIRNYLPELNENNLSDLGFTSFNSKIVHKNNDAISVGVSILKPDSGNYVAVICEHWDRNERKDSEAKLKALFESALDGVVTIDENGIIQTLNPATLNLFGYEKEEMVGKNISMLMPEPDRSHHDQYIASYLKSGKRKIIGIGREVEAQKKNGDLIPIKLSITEIITGGKRSFMGMMHDLTNQKLAEQKIINYSNELEGLVKKRTEEIILKNKELEKEVRERKQIEAELIEGQKLYREIARNFPDGMISVLNEDLNYLFVDGKALFEMGLSSESLIGTNIKDRLPEKIAYRIEAVLQRVFNNKKESIEIDIDNQSYHISAVPLTDIHDRVNRILVVEENVTAQRKAEKRIKAALKKEMELNNLKSRFVSMASHEFRTPLSTVLSSATLIEKHIGEKMPPALKHIERIKSSVQNLTEILNDMLSLSKLEEGIIKIRSERVNIESICHEIVEDMQQQTKEGQLISYIHEGKTHQIESDPHILKNILHNLLSNAIKYSDEGSEITLQSGIDQKEFYLRVEDHGMGIPEEDQPYLFQRFFRAHNASNTEGTGLGLSIVKRYVELLNGKIEFRSEVGKGSEFSLKFNVKGNA